MLTIPMNKNNNFLCNTWLSIMSDGSDSAVIAIIKAKIVPAGTPTNYKASAIGKVPNISA